MFPEGMFFLCMSQVDKFYYEPRLGARACVQALALAAVVTLVSRCAASLQCKSRDRVDPVPFIIGVAAILTQVRAHHRLLGLRRPSPPPACQFHSNYVGQFMKLMGEFVRYCYGLPPSEKQRFPSPETTLLFAETLCRLGSISRSHLDEHVPKHLLDTVAMVAPAPRKR